MGMFSKIYFGGCLGFFVLFCGSFGDWVGFVFVCFFFQLVDVSKPTWESEAHGINEFGTIFTQY